MMVPIAMFGWIPFVLALFALVPPRRAVLAAYLIGWLFLPQAGYSLVGLPDYTRMTAVNGAILLGVAIFDWRRLVSFRLRVHDLPMLILCLCPLPTSLINGLGAYNGLSGVLQMLLTWGVPYTVGRVYFQDRTSLRSLALAVVIGGLIYVPLCLWEMRMAPTLHHYIYGFSSSPFHNVVRLGGYRPRVFMHSGLPLGLWMTMATMIGIWIWHAGAAVRLMLMPIGLLVTGLFVTTVFCRSLGALMLLALGLTVLFGVRLLRKREVLLVFFLLPLVYVVVRANEYWYPQPLVDFVRVVDEDRAASLSSRLHQEEVLVNRAWQRPVFGWSGYGRNRVYDEKSDSKVVTDSLWIITFGQVGLVGLGSLGLCFLVPGLMLYRHLPASGWWEPKTAPAGVLAVVITLYAMDCLMNAMLNPIYHVMMGAVLSFALSLARCPQHEAAYMSTGCTQRRLTSSTSWRMSEL